MIFAAAIVVRLMAVVIMGSLGRPETFEYEAIARSLVAGHGFAYAHLGGVIYRSFTAPLYPWVCAGVYALGLGTGAVILLQIVAGAAHAALIGRLGERLFGPPAGLVAGMLVALHPGLVIYGSLKAHPLTFDALFVTLVVWQLVRLAERPTLRTGVVMGAVGGLAILSRPTIAVLLPLGVAWALWVRRSEWAAMMRSAVVAALVVCAVVAPWVARNCRVQGRFVFMQTTNWEVFWRGNNPAATGHSYATKDSLVFDQLDPSEKAELLSLRTEQAQADWFRERALMFIRDEPGRFVSLTLRKLGQFWWWSPRTGTLYPPAWLHLYQGFYVLILGLAIAGVIGQLRGGGRGVEVVALVVGLCAALSVLQSLHYVEGRHRWAIEPLLLLLAGAGLARLIDALREAARPSRAAAAG